MKGMEGRGEKNQGNERRNTETSSAVPHLKVRGLGEEFGHPMAEGEGRT